MFYERNSIHTLMFSFEPIREEFLWLLNGYLSNFHRTHLNLQSTEENYEINK